MKELTCKRSISIWENQDYVKTLQSTWGNRTDGSKYTDVKFGPDQDSLYLDGFVSADTWRDMSDYSKVTVWKRPTELVNGNPSAPNTINPINSDEVCKNDYCTDYRGYQTKTRTGDACSDWSNSNYPLSYPNAGLINNYCRNPDGDETIWCFSTDAPDGWHYCDPISNTTSPRSEGSGNNGGKSLLWGNGGILPAGVRQGGLGDCWFLAVGAALAEHPERV